MSFIFSLATPSALSYWFNSGSFLGISLVLQIVSGVFLMLNYNSLESYSSIMYIMFEVNYGWFAKLFHSNNASVIFFALYLHLYKNVSISSYRLVRTWQTGLLIIVLLMGAGFSGYVLVGSQMSFWAAMVITSLIGVVPVNGELLMYFIWGGYSISWTTLQMLCVVHFLLPFFTMGVLVLHLVFLHKSGSTSVIYSHSGAENVTFYPYFWVKDAMNIVWYIGLVALILLFPYALGEVELFEEANYLSSPVHIVPEWYFCSSYAILRSVPSKGLGVIIMALSIGVLFLYPYSIGYVAPISEARRSGWVTFILLQVYLSYLGFSPISQPFVLLSLVSTFAYFVYHFSLIAINMLVSEMFIVGEGNSTPLWWEKVKTMLIVHWESSSKSFWQSWSRATTPISEHELTVLAYVLALFYAILAFFILVSGLFWYLVAIYIALNLCVFLYIFVPLLASFIKELLLSLPETFFASKFWGRVVVWFSNKDNQAKVFFGCLALFYLIVAVLYVSLGTSPTFFVGR